MTTVDQSRLDPSFEADRSRLCAMLGLDAGEVFRRQCVLAHAVARRLTTSKEARLYLESLRESPSSIAVDTAAWRKSLPMRLCPDPGRRGQFTEWLSDSTMQRIVNQEALRHFDGGMYALNWSWPGYPAALCSLSQPPAILFCLGDAVIAALSQRSVSMVGTRKPSPYGHTVAKDLASNLARHDFTIVSGMALGIDGDCHRYAMEAGGLTLAVLAGGADNCYPETHRGLYEKIRRQGGFLSEMPPGTKPVRHYFPVRNRLIAALGEATVVVESSLRSGTLNTVKAALNCGRNVLAVPGNIYSNESKGPNQLISEGSMPITSARALLDYLAVPRPGHLPETGHAGPVKEADGADGPILASLRSGPLAFHDLLAASGLEEAELLAELARLQARGYICLHRGQYTLTMPDGSDI